MLYTQKNNSMSCRGQWWFSREPQMYDKGTIRLKKDEGRKKWRFSKPRISIHVDVSLMPERGEKHVDLQIDGQTSSLVKAHQCFVAVLCSTDSTSVAWYHDRRGRGEPLSAIICRCTLGIEIRHHPPSTLDELALWTRCHYRKGMPLEDHHSETTI